MAIADIACNKMKKLFYCLLVAFGLSLLATSCEKAPSGDESNIIGAWMWEKTLYEDGDVHYYKKVKDLDIF